MPISEDIITGKKYRVWSVLANKWKRYSFWSKASDTELNDGTTVENAISTINSELTTSNNKEFNFTYDSTSQKYGYTIDGVFYPFKTAHTGTYTATTRGSALDMGEDHEYRYVNTEGVPNVNTETYSVASNGTKDMGASNNYRYVSVNVSINKTTGEFVQYCAYQTWVQIGTINIPKNTKVVLVAKNYGNGQTRFLLDGEELGRCTRYMNGGYAIILDNVKYSANKTIIVQDYEDNGFGGATDGCYYNLYK